MKSEFPSWIANDKAWLFDLDGTLIDSAACVAAAWRTWCRKHNLDAEEVMQKAHGRRSSDTVKVLLPNCDLDQEVAFLEDLESELVVGLVALPGAHRLLEHISKSPWAIVTSGSNRTATHRMQHAHMPEPMVLISADDVSNGKPDPEGYLLAAQRLNVNPVECIVVEDAVAGVLAGKSAGMKVIAIASTHSINELIDADYVCSSLIELLDGIEKCWKDSIVEV